MFYSVVICVKVRCQGLYFHLCCCALTGPGEILLYRGLELTSYATGPCCDQYQISLCNIHALSLKEVMRTTVMIKQGTQGNFSRYHNNSVTTTMTKVCGNKKEGKCLLILGIKKLMVLLRRPRHCFFIWFSSPSKNKYVFCHVCLYHAFVSG